MKKEERQPPFCHGEKMAAVYIFTDTDGVTYREWKCLKCNNISMQPLYKQKEKGKEK